MPRNLLALAAVQVFHWSGKGRSYRRPTLCRACRAKEVWITVLLLVLLCSSSALADTFGLGNAGPGNWGILEIGGAGVKVTMNAPAGIEGAPGQGNGAANLGINSGSSLSASGNTPLITGTYYKFTGNTDNGTLIAQGGTISSTADNAIISQAVSSASSASTTLAALPGTTISTQITATTTISATGAGRNVISLPAGINLSSNQILTLSANGFSNVSFVINIPSGGMTLAAAGALIQESGLSASNVIFNLTGTGNNNNVSITQNDTVNGIVMDLNGSVSLTNNSTVNGEIISNNNISLQNGGEVETVLPEASTVAYFTFGPLSLAAVMLLHRRFFSRRKQTATRASHDPVEASLAP